MRRIVVPALLVGFVLLAAAPSPGLAGPIERKQAERLQALAARRLLHVKFDAAPVEDVVQFLRVATGWNYVIKRSVIQKAGIDLDAVRTTLDLDDVSAGLVLELVLEPHGLVAKVEGNIVFITTKADAMGKPVFVLYPITQLTWKKTDFHGPDLDLHPSDYHPADEIPEETVVEDDPFTDPQHVVDLVKEMVSEATWDAEGWSITANTQFLMVRAPRSIQRQVARAVDMMGALK
jgi:hypothetical protein